MATLPRIVDEYFEGAVTVAGTVEFLGDLLAKQLSTEEIDDPGTGVAISVKTSGSMAITTGGSGETNTCAIPTFRGQRILFCLDVDGGGNRVITFASAINVAGNTVATFATARQSLTVECIQLAGVLAWDVVNNNGSVALS